MTGTTRTIKILRNIHSAMNGDGKVLIIEIVIPEGNEPHPSKDLDVVMLVNNSGKERTKDKYRKLLKASGFRLTKVIPTKSPYSVVEGERA